MAEAQTPAAPKATRKPTNPYTITPESISQFVDGKTVTVEGWRIKLAAKRGETAKSVLVSEPNLTRALLDSVIASLQGTNS